MLLSVATLPLMRRDLLAGDGSDDSWVVMAAPTRRNPLVNTGDESNGKLVIVPMRPIALLRHGHCFRCWLGVGHSNLNFPVTI